MGFLDAILGTEGKVKIGEITPDAATVVSHSYDAQVTEHPVESGAVIADHVVRSPDSISIEGLISNTPIATGFPGQSAIDSVSALVSGDDLPSVVAFREFERLFDEGDLMTIETAEKIYTNMKVVALSIPKTSTTGKALPFSLTAKKLNIVETLTVNSLALVNQATQAAQSAADNGKKATQAANTAQESKASLLVQLGGSLGIL